MRKIYWPSWKTGLYRRWSKGNFAVLPTEFNDNKLFDHIIDLSDKKIITLSNIIFDKAYIGNIKDKLKAISLGSSSRWSSKYFSLGSQEMFDKVNTQKKLKINELKTIVANLPYSNNRKKPLYNFKFDINFSADGKEKIRNEYNDYLNDFVDGNLVEMPWEKKQDFPFQAGMFILAFRRNQKKFGNNQKLYDNDIWTRPETIKEGSFLELIFSLEKEKYIEILDYGLGDFIFISGNPYVKIKALSKLLTAEVIDGRLTTEIEKTKIPEVKIEINDKKLLISIGKEKFPIGWKESMPSKLLSHLCQSKFGTPMTIFSVIDALGKLEDSEIQDPITREKRMKEIIKTNLGEIQEKINKGKWTIGVEYLSDKKNLKGALKNKRK